MNVPRTCICCGEAQGKASELSRRRLCTACESIVVQPPSDIVRPIEEVTEAEQIRVNELPLVAKRAMELKYLKALTAVVEYGLYTPEAFALRGKILAVWYAYTGGDARVLYEGADEEIAAKAAAAKASEERRLLAEYRRKERLKEMEESKKTDEKIARHEAWLAEIKAKAPTSNLLPEVMARLTPGELAEYKKALG